jgi:hypothetical protein
MLIEGREKAASALSVLGRIESKIQTQTATTEQSTHTQAIPPKSMLATLVILSTMTVSIVEPAMRNAAVIGNLTVAFSCIVYPTLYWDGQHAANQRKYLCAIIVKGF